MKALARALGRVRKLQLNRYRLHRLISHKLIRLRGPSWKSIRIWPESLRRSHLMPLQWSHTCPLPKLQKLWMKASWISCSSDFLTVSGSDEQRKASLHKILCYFSIWLQERIRLSTRLVKSCSVALLTCSESGSRPRLRSPRQNKRRLIVLGRLIKLCIRTKSRNISSKYSPILTGCFWARSLTNSGAAFKRSFCSVCLRISILKY